IGLALGSAAGSWLLRIVRPAAALGWCQILLIGGIAWTAYMIADSLPYWPPLTTTGPWHTLPPDLDPRPLSTLPATVLRCAIFPLALAAVAKPGEDSGRLVGGIYAANTLGAIAGALIVSLALIPWIGTQQSQRALLALSALAGLVVLVPNARNLRARVA